MNTNFLKCLIIIPCFNEAERLPVEEYISFIEKKENTSISFLFINDGSTDNTIELISDLQQRSANVNVLNLKNNKGKAEAIRIGVLQINQKDFDYIGYFDADLAAPLDEIPRLLKVGYEEEAALLIIGSRVKLLGSTNIQRKLSRHYIGRVFATIVSNMLKLPIYDTQCGAKLIKSEVAKALFEDPFASKWLFDVELIFRIKKASQYRNGSIYELPLKNWVHKSGSKINILYYFKAPFDLLKIYFRYY